MDSWILGQRYVHIFGVWRSVACGRHREGSTNAQQWRIVVQHYPLIKRDDNLACLAELRSESSKAFSYRRLCSHYFPRFNQRRSSGIRPVPILVIAYEEGDKWASSLHYLKRSRFGGSHQTSLLHSEPSTLGRVLLVMFLSRPLITHLEIIPTRLGLWQSGRHTTYIGVPG